MFKNQKTNLKRKKGFSKIVITTLLFSIIIFSTNVFAEIPKGTVVIGEFSYSLDYANAPINAYEIGQAVIKSNNKIYVKLFDGSWFENATNKIVDKNLIPTTTYKDEFGKLVKYKEKDGEEIKDSNSKVKAYVKNTNFGSMISIEFTEEGKKEFEKATKYRIFKGNNEISGLSALNEYATAYPPQHNGDKINVKLYDNNEKELCVINDVELQEKSSNPTEATIVSIDNIEITLKSQHTNTMPKTVTAKMSDGSTKQVPVTWNENNISQTPNYLNVSYVGKVDNYSKDVQLVVHIELVPEIPETMYCLNDLYRFLGNDEKVQYIKNIVSDFNPESIYVDEKNNKINVLITNSNIEPLGFPSIRITINHNTKECVYFRFENLIGNIEDIQTVKNIVHNGINLFGKNKKAEVAAGIDASMGELNKYVNDYKNEISYDLSNAGSHEYLDKDYNLSFGIVNVRLFTSQGLLNERYIIMDDALK